MDAARHDLDEREKVKALELLSRCDQDDPLVAPLRRLLQEFDAIPPPPPRWYTRRALAARDSYFRLVARPRFARLIGFLFGLWALASLVQILGLTLDLGESVRHLSFANVCSLVPSLVAGVLVITGLVRLA